MKSLLLFGLLSCAHAASVTPRDDKMADWVAEAIRFPTYAENPAAHAAQKQWLFAKAAELGLVARDAGTVMEIELPGPAGAPVLGLMVHGDVQPVDEKAWTVPPFKGLVRGGEIIGRGAADDKGPMVQALFAMAALKGAPLTQTIRLLVGTDEESGSSDMTAYLKDHAAPSYSLVLDSEFPVVVGEKAFDGLAVVVDDEATRGEADFDFVDLEAGLASSIVPDRARALLRWRSAEPHWAALSGKLREKKLGDGIMLEVNERGRDLEVIAHGKSAHSGVNIQGGRNALVALARAFESEVPPSGYSDLLDFARIAGQDLVGTSLGLPAHTAAGWPGWTVNVALVNRKLKRLEAIDGKLRLVINLRRPPPMNAAQSKEYLFAKVRELAPRLRPYEYYFADEPLVFDRNAKLIRRLMDDYQKATGERPPEAISGGGTYAKRIPNAIAFGMWFPGKPYPGHDVDEKAPVADLHRGFDVLMVALRDLATSPPMKEPFKP